MPARIGSHCVGAPTCSDGTVLMAAMRTATNLAGQIAKRAGMSSALAHHYFGSKDQIFSAAMRHILSIFGAEVRGALAMAKTPK